MSAWVLWLVAAAALAGAEALSGSLFLIMLAGGAAAGGLTEALSGSEIASVLVAAVVAVTLVLGVRPYAQRRLTPGDGGQFGTDRLIGMEALVVAPVDRHGGRVRIAGQEWSARAAEPAAYYALGTSLRVLEIDGATAVVWHGG